MSKKLFACIALFLVLLSTALLSACGLDPRSPKEAYSEGYSDGYIEALYVKHCRACDAPSLSENGRELDGQLFKEGNASAWVCDNCLTESDKNGTPLQIYIGKEIYYIVSPTVEETTERPPTHAEIQAAQMGNRDDLERFPYRPNVHFAADVVEGVYHRLDCDHLPDSSQLAYFSSEASAKQRGYAVCFECRDP